MYCFCLLWCQFGSFIEHAVPTSKNLCPLDMLHVEILCRCSKFSGPSDQTIFLMLEIRQFLKIIPADFHTVHVCVLPEHLAKWNKCYKSAMTLIDNDQQSFCVFVFGQVGIFETAPIDND